MSKLSIVLRSVIYNIVFYLNLLFWVLAGIPTYLMSRNAVIWLAVTWGRTSMWWLDKICNVKTEIRGLENIPAGQPLIVASKHQSIAETFTILRYLSSPLYILKRELTLLPLFGWYLIKADMIAVNRSAGKSALVNMTKKAREEIRSGRQLIIFPEGTRKAVDAPPAYKYGVAQIYSECDVPCMPVALNTGLFWPRRKFLRFPGTLVIEFLPVIPAGLPTDEFFKRMENAIETNTNRLVEDGRREQAKLLSFRNAP